VTAAVASEGKRRAAIRAADYLREGMIVGLGTGSTVRYLLDEIAARRAQGDLLSVVGVPTSEETARRARELGIPLGSLEDHPSIDLTIDGADEVDPRLDLIKGLGGALLREKVVASVSRELVIIVDESKLVTRLGTRGPLPVEVDAFAGPVVRPFLAGLGSEPVLRLASSGEAYRTDGGNLIFDCHFPGGIEDARGLEAALASRPGVLESGLFVGMTDRVAVAGARDVRILSRSEI
jgi:ribose 5-phosphate isomerase A